MLQPPTSLTQDDLVNSSRKLRAAGHAADAERVMRTGLVRASASAPLHCELGQALVTCTGRSFPSRVGASLLKAVGLPELITPDLAAYEALALCIASNPGRLERVRARLSALRASAPLFAMTRYTRQHEAAYQQVVATAHAGCPPLAFTVDELH